MSVEFGYVKDGKVFLKSFRRYADRAIGEVRDTEENALNYFVKRFSVMEGKVEKLVTGIETAQNKGSYLMSLQHLKEAVLLYNALGDFDALLKKLESAEERLEELIQQNRIKNKQIKENLIEEAQTVASNPDWKEATKLLSELNLKWIKTGKADKGVEETLEKIFRTVFADFYERKKAFYDDIQLLYLKRLEVYKELLEKVREIHTRKGHPAELKPVQAAWKEVGNVPKSKLHPVIKEYKKLIKEIVKAFKSTKPTEVNYAKWELLAIEIEKIIEAKDFANPDKIKEIQERWRKLGKLPPQKMDILHRFSAAVDKYFEVSYLENTLKRKHPGIELRSTREQLEIKTNLMKEFIRREKMEIEASQASLARAAAAGQDSQEELLLKKKIAFQNKRLDNKTKLLEEIQAKLDDLIGL